MNLLSSLNPHSQLSIVPNMALTNIALTNTALTNETALSATMRAVV